jgi:two-component sensor histidine kinase
VNCNRANKAPEGLGWGNTAAQNWQTPDHDTPVDAATYLHQLCVSISRSKLENREITLALSAQSLQLPAERCWRLGMILYELITNAARHAFDGGAGRFVLPYGSTVRS